ncbi:MAG: family 78 glycoside hydrolase catalytic domain [Bacteroides sp.]|nr:family 78 glycoside hydrolase catalytic domain [Bacteroides sp.]
MRKMLIVLVLGFLTACTPKGALRPLELSCEYLENPSVLDVPQPRLSWINHAGVGIRGQEQTAFQVRVAGSLEKLDNPDLWDSGKRLSDQSFRVKYEGVDLKSRQECWWQVKVWDGDGVASPWSEPAFWRMGLLEPGDWSANWIGAPWEGEEALPKPGGGPDGRPTDFGPRAPLLRKEFAVKGKLTSAVAYVSGLGYFELYLNGSKVGEDLLVPNQTNYGKRPELAESGIPLPDHFRDYKVMYLGYDIKDQLTQGANAIGGILGNGFYNPAKFWTAAYGSPRFLCQVHLTYEDGSEETIISDKTWKASRSPILMNMVYYGEIYDARMEQDGWSMAGFDDGHWEPVVLREAPEGKLVAHAANPDRVTERFDPISIEKIGEGHYLVDFGTEISGWVRFNGVEGPAGQQVQLAFNGNLYSGDNTYIFKGDGPENYAPRFNWFVFSGVEISNWPGELKAEHLTAEAVNTVIEPSATFHTSNELFNQINTIWRRSQIDNMHGGIASDCPHRERSAYTGDGQIACMTVLQNYDARNFYQKWIGDMMDAQNPETGYVPNGAPWQPGCGGGPAWGAAICVMPWEYYTQYGSVDMLEDNYEGMKGYIRYMQTWTGEDGIMFSKRTGRDGKILKWFNLGEWVPPGELIPDDLVHTFYLWYCADLTSRTAKVLGFNQEADQYRTLANKTAGAFHKKFYKEAEGSYGDGGGNTLALKMGVPAEQYEKVVAALKAGVLKNKGHIDTGIIGTRFFFEVLADHGLNQLAFEAMNKTTEPSFGHWIELGSTTTREQWGESGSYNHPMFGGGLTWFYRNLAGMRTDPSEIGYRHIIFKPQPVKEMEHVTYMNNTSYGQGGISWKNSSENFSMEIEVPVSCRATVYVPASELSGVKEGGKQIDQTSGVEFVEMKGEYAVFSVGSGKYFFESKK